MMGLLLTATRKVIYNEGWGQIRGAEGALTERVRELDPSRLVDSVSGWFDSGFGDFHVSVPS